MALSNEGLFLGSEPVQSLGTGEPSWVPCPFSSNFAAQVGGHSGINVKLRTS